MDERAYWEAERRVWESVAAGLSRDAIEEMPALVQHLRFASLPPALEGARPKR